MLNGVREVVEDAYGTMSSTQEPEYLEDSSADDLPKPTSPTPSSKSSPTSPISPVSDSKDPEKSAASKSNSQGDMPTLALAPCQFSMIQSLDKVGFRKYGVHIKTTNWSHAAIIVRTDQQRFFEGKQVVKHWLDQEFIL